MKKILVLLTLIICITGCRQDKEKIKTPAQDGIVLRYTQEEGMDVENYNGGYTIDLYADKLIVFSFLRYDAFHEKTLTDEEYQKIIDFAFSKKILNLEEVTSNSEEDSYTRLCLYFDDGTNFVTNGKSSTDKYYLELADLLYESSK